MASFLMFDLGKYPLIGISGKQYAGKDLLAGLIQKHWPQYQKIPLAYAIKKAYADEQGLTLDQVEANKAQHRPGLIEKGNWGRAQDPDYWLKLVLNSQTPTIISDVRLLREHTLLRQAGALLIRLNADRDTRSARGQLVSEKDPTECELDEVNDWDLVLENNQSAGELEALLLQSLE